MHASFGDGLKILKMCFADVMYIYLLIAASTVLVGITSIILSLDKGNSTEATARYTTFEIQAPFNVQIVVSAVTVFEKMLSAWSSSTRFAAVLWGVHVCIYFCLCAHAGYNHNFRSFLGTWIAFLLNSHLYVQLQFNLSTAALPVQGKVI